MDSGLAALGSGQRPAAEALSFGQGCDFVRVKASAWA